MRDIADTAACATADVSAFDRLLRKQLVGRMTALRHGRLVLEDACGTVVLGDSDSVHPGLQVHLQVLDSAFYRAVARNGSVGAGESYMAGQWRCDNLVRLMQLLVRNRDLLDGMESGLARLGGMALRAWHALRRNTRDGSRRNIAAHYDLGNDFFSLFLSADLMYSSATWTDPADTLETASTRKLERICRKLDLQPTDRVIEIGTGDLAGRYDKLVSIEMVEAVRASYLDVYFGKLGSLLKPDGLALVQAITIEDHRYAQALKSVDFIKRHVFPGSFIPSIQALLAAKTRASDLALIQLEDFGSSYALTVQAWRERFMAKQAQVRAQGFDERFIRMWEFYLAYCEGGFRERSIGVAHLLMAKPGTRRAAWLPEAPAHVELAE